MMKRREFISLLGGAAAAWPIAARGQQARNLPTIGFLGAITAPAQRQWTDAFVQRLRELGWIEGRNIAIEYRWLEGRTERAAEMVAEFVRLKVDVIVTHSAAPVGRGKAGDIGHTNHYRVGGPSRHRSRRESGAPRRQRHRPVDAINRSCWQATRSVARGCARSAQIGHYGQSRRARRRPGEERG
jgi:hypothetical protein